MTEISQCIWDWVREVLYPVSDDVGAEKNGDYLLHYEGWGGFCVAPAWDSTRSDEENEERARAHAEEESDAVIGAWMDEHRCTHKVVDAGYLPNAAYGLTWALFVHRKRPGCAESPKLAGAPNRYACATAGGDRRGSVRILLSGLTSFETTIRPSRAASIAVVPRPPNGSYTVSPGSVRRSMKNRGSCGLKQAR